ncbi:MAG: PQQ-binding-like beta-propeller repeat protein [candidate division WOR-3 bacterium]
MKKLLLLVWLFTIIQLFLGGCPKPQPHKEGDILWSFSYSDPEDPEELASFTSSIFTIDPNGKVYIPAAEIPALLARYSTGGRRWEFTDPEEEEFALAAVMGDDGTIFIGTEGGKFYALTDSATVKCSTRFTSPVCVPPALGADGTIFLQTDDDTLFALDPNTLNRKWAFYRGGGNYSPVIGSDGTVFTAQEESLFALDPNSGQVKWGFVVRQPILASPAIDGSRGLVYVVDDDGWLTAVNLNDGSKEWEMKVGDGLSSPAIDGNGTVYITAVGRLVAIDPVEQVEKWEFLIPGEYLLSMPAVSKEGVVYFLAAAEDMVDSLFAINAIDGTRRWATRLGISETIEEWVSAPKIGADGSIYVGSGKQAFCVMGKGGPAASSWPMFQGDARNSGRAGSY